MHRIFVLTLISSLLIGCDHYSLSNAETHLSGEIINPILDYAILTQNGQTVDTIYLDGRNRFSYTFKTNDSLGLFNFRHGERQLVHLEKGDSLLLRVNTIEFDESMIFSGKGAERSNFLLEMYLDWERENEGFTENYQKQPAEFQSLLDSLQNVRNRTLTQFLTKYDISPAFQEIATAAVRLDNYQRKESYPFSHFGKDKLEFIKNLPEGFYSFRESIDLNNTMLSDLFAYERYINAFIDHETFLLYGDKKPYNTLSFIHNYNEIKVIDKHITNTRIKDSKLLRTARIFLANSNDKNGVEKVYALIHENISNPIFKKSAERFYADHNKMEAGNKIPDLLLIEPYPERKVTLSSRLTKPTVIYFWSYNNQMHMENSHKKAAEYSTKYPEFNFMGININEDGELWKRHLNKHPFPSTNEYRFNNPRDGRRQLLIDQLGKTFLVDKNGTIINSHSNLHRATFENELLAYLNQ